jgi:hypothetical protein
MYRMHSIKFFFRFLLSIVAVLGIFIAIEASLRTSRLLHSHMSGWIVIPQGIVVDIAIPVQVLRICIAWYDRIRADEVVNIRRIPPT